MTADLNSEQAEAVHYGQGPVLVLAGAGAGKTRVLTQRAAYLLQVHKLNPSRLLVLTFTNKAAREMKDRLKTLVGENQSDKIWAGTFHSICARLLRYEIERLEGGYQRRFVIYDPNDQEKLLKTVLVQLELDPTQHRPRGLLRQISALKNQGLQPADYRRREQDFNVTLANAYALYQEQLARHNALDFDDLLLLPLQLFQRFPEVLQRYQRHFEHILVDEYQDTNPVQFALLRQLAAPQQNLFVVGDVDQSIYSFRNADFQIILRFQQDFPQAALIKLETNYRSTRPILAAANTLIDHNRERFDKVLRAARGEGQALHLHSARNEYQEADYVLAEIQRLVNRGQRSYGEICVLYRTNAQSRLFEERLVQHRIPHQVVGAFRFYERKEIKDLMAYLGVIYNPLDDLNLKRILNTPKRGLGAKSLQQLERAAHREGLSLWDALQTPVVLETMPKRTHTALQDFIKLMQRLHAFTGTLAELIQLIYTDSGYREELAKDEDSFEERDAHVRSFMQAAADFISLEPETRLGDFLQHLALISDVDRLQESGQLVRLMTVHAAKGLEFPVVFVTGLEEGIFPHLRAILAEENEDDGPIEEERRLMYVAMTRAEDVLYLTHAQSRSQRGESTHQEISRFLEEIEDHLDQKVSQTSIFDRPPTTDLPASVFESTRLDDLAAGESVYHPDFGNGLVERVYISGSRPIAIVAFPGGFGKRILDLQSAPLQRV